MKIKTSIALNNDYVDTNSILKVDADIESIILKKGYIRGCLYFLNSDTIQSEISIYDDLSTLVQNICINSIIQSETTESFLLQTFDHFETLSFQINDNLLIFKSSEGDEDIYDVNEFFLEAISAADKHIN